MNDGEGAPQSQIYVLKGTQKFPQVEPDVSYWFQCPILSTVSIEDVTTRLQGEVESYPKIGSTKEKEELEELRYLAATREDESAL